MRGHSQAATKSNVSTAQLFIPNSASRRHSCEFRTVDPETARGRGRLMVSVLFALETSRRHLLLLASLSHGLFNVNSFGSLPFEILLDVASDIVLDAEVNDLL